MPAKLYGFADTYMVDGLNRISLHLLHRDLINLEINATTIEEVVELISFTYDNTAREGSNSIALGEGLRQVVMAFVAWRANWLPSYQTFNDLIEEGGNFATDFTRVLLEQLQSN